MEYPSNALVTVSYSVGPSHVLQNREDWRLARGAYRELEIAGMPRTNLLLVGTAGTIRILMEMLWLELREPILTWRRGDRLDLPLVGRVGTLVLHDVDELTPRDQGRVLAWLDQTAGETRVVSTTSVPLWRRVKAGAFSDVLYYRLNAVSAGVVL
jgi:hypothetical protein